MRIPVLAIVIAYLFSFLVDWLIWLDIKRYSRSLMRRRLYAVSSVLCWLFITVVFLIPRRDQDSEIVLIMWMLYAYLSVYASKFVVVLFSLIGKIPAIWKKRPVNLALWVGAPLGVLMFVIMWWGAIVGIREIQVNQVEVDSPRIPEEFDGYRIVQFSDAHVGTWGKDTTFVRSLVDSINSFNPDLIVFTGDIVNRRTEELAPFRGIFARLHARDGVMSVLGNHDYGDYINWKSAEEKTANINLLKTWQKDMGWRLLNNESVPIVHNGDSIMLIGVENWGEPPFRQYGDFARAYPADSICDPYDSRFKILLSHNPEHWRLEVTEKSNIDLTLSGHTHAMQFMISLGSWRWSPAKYRYDLWEGMYERMSKDGVPMRIYVNIGCGEVALPYRIGATPEITIITLRRSQQAASSGGN